MMIHNKQGGTKEETNLSAVISENLLGFQDKSKFPTQSKLPSYSTPFTVNPVSVFLRNRRIKQEIYKHVKFLHQLLAMTLSYS